MFIRAERYFGPDFCLSGLEGDLEPELIVDGCFLGGDGVADDVAQVAEAGDERADVADGEPAGGLMPGLGGVAGERRRRGRPRPGGSIWRLPAGRLLRRGRPGSGRALRRSWRCWRRCRRRRMPGRRPREAGLPQSRGWSGRGGAGRRWRTASGRWRARRRARGGRRCAGGDAGGEGVLVRVAAPVVGDAVVVLALHPAVAEAAVQPARAGRKARVTGWRRLVAGRAAARPARPDGARPRSPRRETSGSWAIVLGPDPLARCRSSAAWSRGRGRRRRRRSGPRPCAACSRPRPV